MSQRLKDALRKGWSGGTTTYLGMAACWSLIGAARMDKPGFNLGHTLGVPPLIASLLIAFLISGPIGFFVGGGVAFVGQLLRTAAAADRPSHLKKAVNQVDTDGLRA